MVLIANLAIPIDWLELATHGKLSIFSGEGQFMTSPGFGGQNYIDVCVVKYPCFGATSSHITPHPASPESK